MSVKRALYIGVAGWSTPRAVTNAFPGSGSHLARYAGVFSGVEINSTFYRPHRAGTYQRWAASVPAGFRFAVKVPRAITHDKRLIDAGPALAAFLAEVAHLGGRLGPLLVQLPPSLAYDARVAARFFKTLRAMFAGPVACEPRHASWFTPKADAVLKDHGVARVAADPAVAPGAGKPGGSDEFAYWRLHGTPRMYASSYADDALHALATRLLRRGAPPVQWCIFDNTARGAAAANALALLEAMTATPRLPRERCSRLT